MQNQDFKMWLVVVAVILVLFSIIFLVTFQLHKTINLLWVSVDQTDAAINVAEKCLNLLKP